MLRTLAAAGAHAAPVFDLTVNGDFGLLDGLATDTAVDSGITMTLLNPDDGNAGTVVDVFGNDNRGAGVNSNCGNFSAVSSFQFTFSEDVFLNSITGQAIDNVNGGDIDNDQQDEFILDSMEISFGSSTFQFGDNDDLGYTAYTDDDTAVLPSNTVVTAGTAVTLTNITPSGFFRVASIEVTPVPEPASIALLAAGSLCLVGRRRRA
jgi:hypothetical protein